MRKGSKPGFRELFITQMTSAVWHGLYAGYQLFFAGTAIWIYFSTLLYKLELMCVVVVVVVVVRGRWGPVKVPVCAVRAPASPPSCSPFLPPPSHARRALWPAEATLACCARCAGPGAERRYVPSVSKALPWRVVKVLWTNFVLNYMAIAFMVLDLKGSLDVYR